MALALALVLVPACGEAASTSSEPASARPALTAEDIDARRAVWERSAPRAYRYVVTSTCGCERNGTFAVTVVADDVVSVEASGAPAGDRYRRWFGQSIDEMFDMFDEAVLVATQEDGRSQARAVFDPERGHPASFVVRWSDQDEPYEGTITGFEALEPGSVDEAAADTVAIAITNQSFDHPDAHITVRIDGDTVIDSVLSVRGQHHVVTYDVPLEPGRHEIIATSDAGARHVEVIEVIAGTPLFVALSHWTDDGARVDAPHFTVHLDDEPFGIA